MTGQELVNTIVARRGSTRFGVTGSWNGGNPTNDWGQCTAVPHDVEVVLFGGVLTYGNAVDMFNNAPLTRYDKAVGNVQILPGDIVVQRQDAVLGTDWPGHIFLSTAASAPGQAIAAYSQNYPTGYPPHYRSFPRNGLVGVLRAKVLSSSGGATVDPRYAEDWANVEYQRVFQRVPTPGERQLRVAIPWDQAKAAIDNAALSRSEGRLWDLLISYYEYGLGRRFTGAPINVDLEIKPRVQQIVLGVNTLYDHWASIISSPEGIAWAKTAAAALKGSDVVALRRLETAKEIARQLKVTNTTELDKIINV